MGYADSFDRSLARTESGGNYSVVNSEGYGGKYQFGQERLDDYNRANGTKYTVAQLVKSPRLQESVQDWHIRDIDNFTANAGLTKFIGANIGGVTITQDSIRAMAHLGGKGGMKRYLESGGRYNPADSNGTSLRDYAGTHSGSSESNQNTQNRLVYQQPPQQQNALQPPQFRFSAGNLDVNDFIQPINRLASVGYDQQTNPFLVRQQ